MRPLRILRSLRVLYGLRIFLLLSFLDNRLNCSYLSMAYNHIIEKKTLGSVVSGGKTLVLSAATQTDYWTRPGSMADKLKSPLEKAVKSSPGKIPSWAEEVCARYVVSLCLSERQPYRVLSLTRRTGKVTRRDIYILCSAYKHYAFCSLLH